MAKRTAHEETIDEMKLAIRQLSLRLQGFTLDIDVQLQHAAPHSSDLLAQEKHRSWKRLLGSANQTPQTSRSMVNYSTTVDEIIRCQFGCEGWAMFPNTIRYSPICLSSAISFTEATASQKMARLSSIISSIFWRLDIYWIVTSARFRAVKINVS
jgi:hypothetical protein